MGGINIAFIIRFLVSLLAVSGNITSFRELPFSTLPKLDHVRLPYPYLRKVSLEKMAVFVLANVRRNRSIRMV